MGHLTLEATLTGGTLDVHGVGELDDLSGGTVISDGLINHEQIDNIETRQILMEKVLRNQLVTDPVAGTLTILDDDGVTTLLTAAIYEDADGTIPYQGTGVDRRNRLT